MKLYYWEGTSQIKNFGDEINPYIWPKLLANLLDCDNSTLLVGIGTILNEGIPSAERKAVFSSGVGYEKGKFKIDDSYKVYCVRGPLSARYLGLDKTLAITDGALLLRDLYQPQSDAKPYKFAYIPHWENRSKVLEEICSDLNIKYIDPTNGVESVIDQVNQVETILAEAMHGAIIADAYRIPWVPIRSTTEILKFKWNDWCMTVNVRYSPFSVSPIWDPSNQNIVKAAKQEAKKLVVKYQLKKIIKNAHPILSDLQLQADLLDGLYAKLDCLRGDLESGYFL